MTPFLSKFFVKLFSKIHPVVPKVERKKKVRLRPILLDKIPPHGLATMAEAMYMAPNKNAFLKILLLFLNAQGVSHQWEFNNILQPIV